MAIAPSKLGALVSREWHSDDALVRRLREVGLVREDASDSELKIAFQRAREEHAELPPGRREFSSPHERVRVLLAPFLSDKGQQWALPLKSLKLPDDGTAPDAPWWKFWD